MDQRDEREKPIDSIIGYVIDKFFDGYGTALGSLIRGVDAQVRNLTHPDNKSYLIYPEEDKGEGEGPIWWETWEELGSILSGNGGYIVHYRLHIETLTTDANGNLVFGIQCKLRVSYRRSYWSEQCPRSSNNAKETPQPILTSQWFTLKDLKDPNAGNLLVQEEVAYVMQAMNKIRSGGYYYGYQEINSLVDHYRDGMDGTGESLRDYNRLKTAPEVLEVYGISNLVCIAVMKRMKSLIELALVDLDMQPPNGPNFLRGALNYEAGDSSDKKRKM
jgi:hypothetical protein